jgi:hypothetical protein
MGIDPVIAAFSVHAVAPEGAGAGMVFGLDGLGRFP